LNASKRALLDSDVFISYLFQEDELYEPSRNLVRAIARGDLIAYVSSELYDDIISALRGSGLSLSDVINVLRDVSKIPHKVLPINLEIALQALELYRRHGGSRKLHYFDSFHVATSKHYGIPLITSDRYIINNSESIEVNVIDLRKIESLY
jgi:predicted nucleic acid-binding protein